MMTISSRYSNQRLMSPPPMNPRSITSRKPLGMPSVAADDTISAINAPAIRPG